MSTSPEPQVSAASPSTAERTGRASGFGRLLVAIYGIFAAAATARAGYQIGTKFSEAPIAYSLSAFAAVVYIIATISLAKRGRTWFFISLSAIGVELLGVIVIGLFSILDPAAFAHDSVWSYFGRGYGFVPLVLPLVGLWWLYRNRADANRENMS
nr:hypothetical protein [Haematomicrobium sanguinis]